MGKSSKGVDVESNGGQLYPGMMEDPGMRWAFIRKVYVILCFQLLITFAVGLVMFFNPIVKHFLVTNRLGWLFFLSACILTLITSFLMSWFSDKHPWNYIFALLFTLCMSLMIGVACAFRRGEIVLQAAALTLLLTIALTLYTFWGAKKGQDFSFLGPFLLCALLVLLSFTIIRIIFPMGRLGALIGGCAGALIFSGFVIYDTNNIIKNYNYDEYILAAAALYSDIINLFLALLSILEGGD